MKANNTELLKNVKMRVANKNRADCDKFIHCDFEDLVVLFVITEEREDGVIFTGYLKNELLDKYELNIEEIKRASYSNVKKNGFKKMRLDSFCFGTSVDQSVPAYVITNKTLHFGANVILFPEEFKEIADKAKSDLYILPSSIHEVITIPVNPEFRCEHLKRMVKEMNETEVSPEEFLSNNIYIYERETNKIRIVEDK